MFKKTKFIAALFLSLLITAANVDAQVIKPKFRTKYNIKKRNSFKRRRVDQSVTLIGGAGLTVLNSDNRGHNFGEDGLRPLGNNGFGQNLNVGAMFKVTNRTALQGNLDYNSFRAAEDKGIETSDVSFKSSAVQVSGAVVVDLINGYYGFGLNRRRVFAIPYAKVGLGVASYKASSFTEGDGEEVQKTELPATRDYPAAAAIVPIGFGIDFQCSRAVSIVPEFTFNITSTDHLDNIIDNAGYSGKNDQFINTSIKVYYKPSAVRKGYRRRR